MTREEIIFKINTSVSDLLGVDISELKRETTFDYLDCNELDVVEIIMDVEKEFDISLPDDELFDDEGNNGILKDMGQLYDIVISKIKI